MKLPFGGKTVQPGFARGNAPLLVLMHHFPRRGKFALRLAFMSCGTMHSVHSPTAKRGGRWCRRHQRGRRAKRASRRKAVISCARRALPSPLNLLNPLNPLNLSCGAAPWRHHNPRAGRRVKPKNPPAKGRLNLRTFLLQKALRLQCRKAFLLRFHSLGPYIFIISLAVRGCFLLFSSLA